MHQVATGPYMIKNNASGSINGVGYKPGQLIDLVRNPNWNAKTSWRPAYANQIVFKEGYQDPTVLTQDDPLGTGGRERRHAASARRAPVDPRQPKQKTAARLHADGREPLRRAEHEEGAVQQAARPRGRRRRLDRNAMRLTRGGASTGIATHFIDPSFGNRGFTQAGGLAFDPFPSPGFSGNVAKAKALLKQAGLSQTACTPARR